MRPKVATIPLSDWADAQLAELASHFPVAALRELSGHALVAMRARFNRFCVPGQVSAGGGCRLLRTTDGWIALNLARGDDHGLLPALIGQDVPGLADPAILAVHLGQLTTAAVLEQGRLLGLALAGWDETPPSPAVTLAVPGQAARTCNGPPVVIDLSALWAGPLAGKLLRCAGARVIKVQSRSRPDRMREGDPLLFAFLDEGKEQVTLDLREDEGRAALLAMIRTADVVIEAARPRGLRQLGIDADALVRDTPGLVWLTITGHGFAGAAADWTGFGDDTAVAGGLTRALYEATGTIGFVGDAIADPLTGIIAACTAAAMLREGTGGRVAVSMSGVVAQALAQSRADYGPRLHRQLADWAAAVGHPLAWSKVNLRRCDPQGRSRAPAAR